MGGRRANDGPSNKLNNIMTTLIQLTRGTVVHHGGYRSKGKGIVLSVTGSFDPEQEEKLGGFIHVVKAGNDGHCSVAWPNGSHPAHFQRAPAIAPSFAALQHRHR